MKKFTLYFLWVSSIYLIFFTDLFARAGWWGGGWWGWGGWWWSWGDWWWVWTVIFILLYALYYLRRKKLIIKAERLHKKAFILDASWHLDDLKNYTKMIFLKYQECRMKKNLSEMERFMTKSYFQRAKDLMNENLYDKINILEKIKVNEMILLAIKDVEWKNGDMFAMEIKASMIDYTIYTDGRFSSSTLPRSKNESNTSYEKRSKYTASSFIEFYIFKREDWIWKLWDIKQAWNLFNDIKSYSERDIFRELLIEKFSDETSEDLLFN